MIVLFCWLMFMTMGFMAVTLNIGVLLMYHGHLQTSVDNAVYSGAVMQARGLNEIARINTAINRELDRAANTVGRGIFSSRAAGRNAANRERSRFEALNRSYRARQAAINRQQPGTAVHVARDIANRNQNGLSPVEFSDYSHGRTRLTEMNDRNGDSRNFRFRYYYWRRIGSGDNVRWVRRVRSDSIGTVRATMQAKGTTDHTYFSARLRQPAYPFPFKLGGLWPSTFENLRVYATAMPFGGYLWDGRRAHSKYDVKLVQTGEVRPRPIIPDAWGYEW